MFCVKGGNRSYPALFCDVCLEEITDWKMANVEYETSPATGADKSVVIVAHKGCTLTLTPKLGECRGDPRYWMDLKDYLTWLISNNGWGDVKGDRLIVSFREPLGF